MKNRSIRNYLAIIIGLVAFTFVVTAFVLYYSEKHQKSIQAQVTTMTKTIVQMDESLKALQQDKQMKEILINTQEQDIQLKDSLLDLSQAENKYLKNRLIYTQAQLRKTRKELDGYAAKLDSLQSLDSLQRFDLPNRKKPNP